MKYKESNSIICKYNNCVPGGILSFRIAVWVEPTIATIVNVFCYKAQCLIQICTFSDNKSVTCVQIYLQKTLFTMRFICMLLNAIYLLVHILSLPY